MINDIFIKKFLRCRRLSRDNVFENFGNLSFVGSVLCQTISGNFSLCSRVSSKNTATNETQAGPGKVLLSCFSDKLVSTVYCLCKVNSPLTSIIQFCPYVYNYEVYTLYNHLMQILGGNCIKVYPRGQIAKIHLLHFNTL